MNNKVYVTTTIPYVNARPHLGFALEVVQADTLARYHRLQGREVRFQTGTDENAFKNVLAAREHGVPTQQWVDENSLAFRELCLSLDIGVDDFIRTTELRHRLGVELLWQQLRAGDVYRGRYKGLYCDGCEDFLTEKDLVDGCCPDHGLPPAACEEENYFFRLSSYQERIERLIESDRINITPAKRKNEVLAFVRRGLQDICISRNASRSDGWGIAVPGDSSQVIYVWIDALVNYICGPGFGSGKHWRDWWSDDVRKIHFIGKNVWKFHALYWPALLLSAGLSLPDEIVVHGFLTEHGRKISKSRGNDADPGRFIDTYGAEALRYYLLRAVSPFDDGDFSSERLHQLYHADLANGLGNLVCRVTTLAGKVGCDGVDPASPPEAPEGFHDAIGTYRTDTALRVIWSIVDNLNQEIERTRPWERLKYQDAGQLRDLLTGWLHEIHRVAYWVAPFLPATSKKLLSVLQGHPVTVSPQLFPRINK